jgi:2-desacetyl-2-hydroxyethyl bacteriochlorophyllide A dehydrogenase
MKNMGHKMKAAVLMGPNELKVKEVDLPKPALGEVLIQVQACAICSSDVSLIEKPWFAQPPFGKFIPGHEYSGIIAALGEDVKEFKVGDRVAVEAHSGCGRCINCRRGNYTACLNYGNIQLGHRANGFTTNGGYAQYVVNRVNTVYSIPDSISFEEASLLTNLGCILYGFETIGGYIVGDTIAVIGPGPLGLLAVEVGKILAADKVWLIGTRDSRLEVGQKVGADRIININQEDAVKLIIDETKGLGVDLVIVAAGGNQVFDTTLKIVKRMGKILLLSFPEEPVPLNLGLMGKNNVSLYTVRGEGRANCARAASLMASGKLSLKPLITHTFVLDEIWEGFQTFIKRNEGAIKVIIKPNQ